MNGKRVQRQGLHPWARIVLLISVCPMVLTACSGGPPFNSYDPPPTFAFRYVASDPRLTAVWAGGALQGQLLADLVDPTFLPQGSTTNFNQGVLFGVWYTINNGRWPALWRVSAVAGCGTGSSTNAEIRTKLPEFVCVPRTTNISVSPSSYQGSAPPSTLSLQFDLGSMPAGTSVHVWILDSENSTIISGPYDRVIDGAGLAHVPAPSPSAGYYYVVAESPTSEPLLDGGVGGFQVTGGAPPPTGRYKSDGHGGCYWDPNDSGPDQCSPPTGRYKSDGHGGCYWDPDDSGPDQCSPE